MSKPRVVAIVQARLGSSRLPRKVLADIGGKAMVARVAERVRMMRSVDHVVVACPLGDYMPICEAVPDSLGVAIRGSLVPEADVLGRYVEVAREWRADVVVRVTADCALFDPVLGDEVVNALLEHRDCDYASNVLGPQHPRGTDCEALWLDTLLRLDRKTTTPREREHVTQLLRDEDGDYDEPSQWDTYHVRGPFGNLRNEVNWSVDTAEDLERVRAIYAACNNEPGGWQEVLAAMRKAGIS